MGKIVKTFQVGGTALLLVFGVALLAFGLPSSGWKALSVQTGSMEPGIKPGHLLLVQRVPANNVHSGDIITYISQADPSQSITHRVVEVVGQPNGPKRYITKGDANTAPDPQPVNATQVVGKVAYTLPALGFVADFLRTPFGLLLAVYVPALIIVIGEIRRLTAHYESQKVFRLSWVKGRLYRPTKKDRLIQASKVGLACLAVALAIAIPARAMLTSEASLIDSNIISTLPASDHVLIIRVFFREGSNPAASIKPRLMFFNPTQSTISLDGWKIEDTHGEIWRFRGATRVEARRTLTFNPPNFADGFQYQGDSLLLKKPDGQVVDAISWGNDTTQLDPSIQNIEPGDKIKRSARSIDTNSAADWVETTD